MLKHVVDFGKQLFSLTRDVQQNKADIKELREEVKALRQELVALARVVERLTVEIRHDRETAEKDREIQYLRLKNELRMFERRLPPPDRRAERDDEAT